MRIAERCTTGLRTFVPCLAVIVTAATASTIVAQTATTLEPGTRIRVTAASALSPAKQSGRLLSMRSDSLELQPDGSESPVAVPRESVTELDVSARRRGQTGRGIAIDLLVGAGLGAGFGAATYSAPHCGNTDFGECLSESIADAGGRGGRAAAFAILCGIPGAIVGGLLGHAHPRELWARLDWPLASLFRVLPDHMSVTPSGRRMAVMLRI